MSEMQWALVVIGVVVVAGVYVQARRRAAQQAVWSSRRQRESAREDQMDLFGEGAKFDELGVSKPRPAGSSAQQAAAPGPAPKAAEPAAAASPGQPAPEVIVISVAQRDLHVVPGRELHTILQACGLQFGDQQLYHRFDASGAAQFSVASSVKPGYLNPDEADALQTPGVSLFLRLPCAGSAVGVFEDLLATAQSIAKHIDGVLIDQHRQPLDDAGIAALRERAQAFAS